MFREHRPVWAEINLDDLASNMREIRRITKSREIIAVIKADGYGHGALEIAPTLLENGATRIAVAVVTEAVELRKGGITCSIMVLGYTPAISADVLVEFDIEQTVYSYDLASEISKAACKAGKVAKLHIAVDTGMGRIGFIPNEESLDVVYKINKLPNILLQGIFSHFSTADEKNKEYSYVQLEKFNWFYNKLILKGIVINLRHVANSAAIIDLPQVHFDACRPGIILYGYYPSNQVLKERITLKPVMTLKANIVNLKKVSPGEYISYGRKFKTEKESLIATLPIGYADGYNRLLSNKAMVILNDKLVPVVGKICMDQCMIDVTGIGDIKIGDEVILMGESKNNSFTGDDIAEIMGTINYEVTCMISKRVPRVYIKNGEVVKVRNYV